MCSTVVRIDQTHSVSRLEFIGDDQMWLYFFVFILCCSIFVFLVNVCFCYVRFSFSVQSQEIGWEERLGNVPFCVWRDIKPHLSQSEISCFSVSPMNDVASMRLES